MHKHHIIPRHLGGTDDPDNLVEVSIEEHAEIHRCLWIYGGRWQDEVAYKGLSRMISRKEAIWLAQSRANKGVPKSRAQVEKQTISRSRWWEVTSPQGDVSVIKNLTQFCRDHNLDQGTMSAVAQGKHNYHCGWKCKQLGE